MCSVLNSRGFCLKACKTTISSSWDEKKISGHIKAMLVKTLVELGALQKKKTGPSMPRTPSEARRVKRERCKEGVARKKQLIAEAEQLGLPPPVFQRGRPRKYETEEERQEARRRQFRIASLLYKDRVKQGLEAFKEQTTA